MANVGVIEQYQFPFKNLNNEDSNSKTIEQHCKIGISVKEDDFMSWGPGQDIIFEINGQEIHMGRTYIYLTLGPINGPVTINFPNGAPDSTLIEITYCNKYINEEE